MKENDLLASLTVRRPLKMPRYLKWYNTTVGYINDDYSVKFDEPMFSNRLVLLLLFAESEVWSPQQFRSFLEERIPSRSRRDIEKILMRCGMSEYDPFRLAAETRAINAKDLLWLAHSNEEKFDDVITDVFKSVFLHKQDLEGESVNSPEGVNVKRYAVNAGRYGILKKRLHPYSSDVESEVAVFHLARLLGVKCCPSWLVGEGNDQLSFSAFEYDFAKEYIVNVRRIMGDEDVKGSLYDALVAKLPAFKDDIRRMVIIDFLTRQTDRHLSNFALKVIEGEVEFYPLYDNGRSLFYEDKEELIKNAVANIELYSSEFGAVGTYFDAIQDISKEINIASLVNLDISESDVRKAYYDARIPEERLDGAVAWTIGCIELIKKL